MSGPGDIDGEVSGDEAAWRDLVARFDAPVAPVADTAPWPEAEDLPGQAPAPPDPPADPSATPDQPGAKPAGVSLPIDRTRVIRPAGDPRSYSPPEEEDEPYVPEPLPPPGKLDPVTKGAWAAVIGGPGYLLIATIVLHWSISGIAAFAAVAAFVGGFITLVIKLGDHSRGDDDDNGAVL
jgi:hypothetical protein